MQALLEGLAQRGALTSAACCLLVVDCLEGSASAQRLTLSLLQVCGPPMQASGDTPESSSLFGPAQVSPSKSTAKRMSDMFLLLHHILS